MSRQPANTGDMSEDYAVPLFITSGQNFDPKASANALSTRGAKWTPSSRESAEVAQKSQKVEPVAQKSKNLEERTRPTKKSAKLVGSPEKPSIPATMESEPSEGDAVAEPRKDFV
ncbi:hypothetical protein TSMEX_007798 [Taenia solium]|eukprot:TsM_000688700 transcript=TsM_000688700 gene=TsM_000688700